MQNIEKLKAYFKKNPLMGFVAVIVFVTIFLGIGAFIGTRPSKSDTDKITPTPTEEVSDDEEDSDSGTSASDTTDSEHKAEPTATNTEGNITATPTKSITSTPGPTATPSVQTYNINFLGDIFSDDNCNGTQDSNESRIKDVVVNIFKSDNSAFASIKTDGNGHYSYNGTQNKGDQITLKVQPVAPDNYTIRDSHKSATATVSEGNPSSSNNFPLVPNDKVSSCN